MTTKVIPFGKKKETIIDPASGPKLTSRGPQQSSEGAIVDYGTLGDFDYEIYKRGVIRIFGKKLEFKKDINLFENEIDKLDFGSMTEGSEIIIKGSGDNDHLVFKKVNGDIDIVLKKREFSAIETLRKVLSKGKDKLLGQEIGGDNV
jgi:hypothetical protein